MGATTYRAPGLAVALGAAAAVLASSGGGPAAATPARAAASTSWVIEARNGPDVAVDRHEVVLGDGVRVDVIRFRKGAVTYALHAGSVDPGQAARGLKGGPAVSASERPKLLAGFNGGFQLKAGTGGYMQEKRVISPLRYGYASLVIGPKGNASIVSWPTGVPAGAVSVRQNLSLLISGGHLSPQIDDPDGQVWGWTLSKKFVDARSAVATDSVGNLLYAASMHTDPRDLATALLRCGARTAMELDINPQWVQLDYAHTKGGALLAAVTGQQRPPNQFLSGFTRDFFAVLAAPRAQHRPPSRAV